VTESGTRTAHTAILARSLATPAVVGVQHATREIPPGALVLVDGEAGTVTVDPAPALVQQSLRRTTFAAARPPRLTGPVATADGIGVELYANVERPEDVPFALREGASGLGLVRSELLMGGVALVEATEELQFNVYATLVEAAGHGAEVTIRTFDVTAQDAGLAVSPDTDLHERLGLRGLRLSLTHPTLFDRQVRALLRASILGHVRIMFPFVTQVSEMDRAVARVAGLAGELDIPAPPMGPMVEVPAAALDAGRLAARSTFLSVGTNDLIQYTLAADRNDSRVSHLYDPLHPAVLRLLRLVARAGRRVGRRVSVCGEMAGEPALLAVLLGLGFREFSMAASALRAAREVIGHIALDDARAAARQALAGLDVSSTVPAGRH
jgi:phosphoenolpyruvate-protein phosphotransferase (PTS system enzyme I)